MTHPHRRRSLHRRLPRLAPGSLPAPTPDEVVAHELRTPLTSLLVAGHVLQREGLRQEVRRQVAQDVVAESERLAASVEDLLALINRADGAEHGEPLSLPRLLRAEIDRAAGIAPGGVRFRAFVPAQLPVALADEQLLAHLVRNLLAIGQAVAAPRGTVEAVATGQDGRLALTVTARPAHPDRPAPRPTLTVAAARRVAARLGADLRLRVTPGRYAARLELQTLDPSEDDAG